MYAHIRGPLIEATPSYVVIEAQGIGFFISIPVSHFGKLPALGQMVMLHTTLVIREDAHRLYGFLCLSEKLLFEQLIEISGIGPKTALGLIGHMPIDQLHSAIQHEQIHLICKIPGIGKKTAERLIIEMRDKIKLKGEATLPKPSSVVEDATSALSHLGYHSSQIQKALKRVLTTDSQEPELTALITAVLKVI